jgi:zinc transport system substrate-binding protein
MPAPRWTPGCLGACLLVLASACERAAPQPPHIRVVVSIPPLAGLVREVLPAGAEVSVLIPSTRSEHGYDLTPADVSRLGRADAIVYVGLGLEPGLVQFLRTHPGRGRVDICFAEEVAPLLDVPNAPETDEHEEHAHQEDDGHEHGPLDPHLWLDPELVERFAASLGDRLAPVAARHGGSEAQVRAAAEALGARITALDAELRAELAPLAGQAIVTHHAAFARFAARYGLTVAEVIRPADGLEASPGALARTAERIRSMDVRGVFREPQYDRSEAERLARLAGVRLGVLDPLGSEDWFTLMRANARTLLEVLGGDAPPPP